MIGITEELSVVLVRVCYLFYLIAVNPMFGVLLFFRTYFSPYSSFVRWVIPAPHTQQSKACQDRLQFEMTEVPMRVTFDCFWLLYVMTCPLK